jgi:putative ATP-dependent endonuclease of the OLD family
VRTYPELYFARFVVLGEGASEEVVLPRLADALGFAIDRSFVAVVPLGGRHVNHLWRLLNDLGIPHATLLDLDWGRAGGGWGRIKTACAQLLENGVMPQPLFGVHLHANGPAANIAAFDDLAVEDFKNLDAWAKWLRQFGVFYCGPLDLDYSMLRAFPAAYHVVEPGRQGPSNRGDPRSAVLGEDGLPALYGADQDEALRWYRYLFLGRGKPSTHVRVLSALPSTDLAAGAPEELRALLTAVVARREPAAPVQA